jgi:hypothetical protein
MTCEHKEYYFLTNFLHRLAPSSNLPQSKTAGRPLPLCITPTVMVFRPNRFHSTRTLGVRGCYFLSRWQRPSNTSGVVYSSPLSSTLIVRNKRIRETSRHTKQVHPTVALSRTSCSYKWSFNDDLQIQRAHQISKAFLIVHQSQAT